MTTDCNCFLSFIFKGIHPEPVSELVVQKPKTMGKNSLRSTLYKAGDSFVKLLIVALWKQIKICFNVVFFMFKVFCLFVFNDMTNIIINSSPFTFVVPWRWNDLPCATRPGDVPLLVLVLTDRINEI